MKKIRYVTASQMKNIDRTAIERHKVPAKKLMEKAGKAVASEARKLVKRGSHVLVIAGYGNNGGDGFVAARYLKTEGYSITLFLVGRPKIMSREAEANLGSIIDLECPASLMSTSGEMERAFSNMDRCQMVIDAVFGTGIKAELDQFYVSLIEKINSLKVPIVSVDIPSGLNADTGEPASAAIKATKTVTLALPKLGFKNPLSKKYTGDVIVADIGIQKTIISEVLDK